MSSETTQPKNSLVMFNACSNYLRFTVAIACTLILTPLVVGQLGAKDYGLWTLVLCISGYLELFDLGLTTGAMRFIAMMGDGHVDRKNQLVSTLVATSLAVVPIVGIAGTGIVLWMTSAGQVVTADAGAAESIPLLIGMVALRVAITLPLGVLMGVLFGEHRIWMINVVRTCAVTIFTIAAATALTFGGGILELGIWYAIVYSLEYVFYGLFAVRLVPWLKINICSFDAKVLREVLGFSTSSLTANASNVVLMRTDPFLVSIFLSLSAVTFYAVPMRIAEQLFAVSKQLINVFSPLFAQLHGAGRRDSIRSAYIVCTKFSLGLMVGIVGPAVFFARDGLRFWIGDEFADSSSIMTILLAAAVFRTVHESSANALAMTGQHGFIARISILSAIANILFSLLLVGPLGLAGVATGTLLSVAILGCCVTTIRVLGLFELGSWEFVRTALLPCLAPSIVQLCVLLLLSELCPPSGLFSLFWMGCVAFQIYVAAFASVSLRAIERTVALRWMQGALQRLLSIIQVKSPDSARNGTAPGMVQEIGQ